MELFARLTSARRISLPPGRWSITRAYGTSIEGSDVALVAGVQSMRWPETWMYTRYAVILELRVPFSLSLSLTHSPYPSSSVRKFPAAGSERGIISLLNESGGRKGEIEISISKAWFYGDVSRVTTDQKRRRGISHIVRILLIPVLYDATCGTISQRLSNELFRLRRQQ